MKSDWKDYQYHEAAGKPIHIFDNLLTEAELAYMYGWCIKDRQFGWNGRDTSRPEHAVDYNLALRMSAQEGVTSPLMRSENVVKYVQPLVKNRIVAQARINLCTIQDRNHFHVDLVEGGLTLLYYPNMEWHREWGGYTLFSNDSGDGVDFTSFYKPGRVIVFDSRISHCIVAGTHEAPFYRLSFVIQYLNEEDS